MSPLEGRRVLLVEDEAVIAFAVEDMLTDIGCVVVGPAYRLDTACALAKAEELDAAILDVNLNDERSYAAASILRLRGIPFVFATGYAESGVDWGDGLAPVIAKPYHREALAQALADLLA